jgi:DNA-binding MarR family transcriptional regulator
MACEILFEAIILKVDDLNSSLRQFFDKLKEYIKQNGNGKLSEYQFTQREIRLALNLSKGTCFRHMEDLEQLEYIQKSGGYSNKGFKYKIVFWDDMEKIRAKIKDELNKQLEQLGRDKASLS